MWFCVLVLVNLACKQLCHKNLVVSPVELSMPLQMWMPHKTEYKVPLMLFYSLLGYNFVLFWNQQLLSSSGIAPFWKLASITFVRRNRILSFQEKKTSVCSGIYRYWSPRGRYKTYHTFWTEASWLCVIYCQDILSCVFVCTSLFRDGIVELADIK